jgi:iron complex transport system substrate-binding protein
MGAANGPRIVSLLPSATEIVAGLGLADHLVGRSHECDFPAEVEALPVVSDTKIKPGGSSREIDQRVQTIVAQGLAVYKVHTDLLRELRPDFVLTQTQCAVCAVTPADVENALCEWTGATPTMISLEPDTLDDLWGEIRRVGDALDVAATADKLVATLRGRLETIAQKAASLPRPTVADLDWMDPLIAGGNWMPELIETAGGENLFGQRGEHSPPLDWATLAARDPDVILLHPCGFKIEQSIADLESLTGHPQWHQLRAVREGRAYILDGHHFFNRPGPRLVESTEIIAEILHPEAFDFGHRGTGWVAVDDLPASRSRSA